MFEQYCQFCEILKKSTQEKPSIQLLFQDDKYFVFNDINKANAIDHILVCTKQHIPTALDLKDPKIITQMKDVGHKVLDKLAEQKGVQKQYRFGFHLKPWNSINHIHLHCFIEPLSSFWFNKILYGWIMNSPQSVINKLKRNIEE